MSLPGTDPAAITLSMPSSWAGVNGSMVMQPSSIRPWASAARKIWNFAASVELSFSLSGMPLSLLAADAGDMRHHHLLVILAQHQRAVDQAFHRCRLMRGQVGGKFDGDLGCADEFRVLLGQMAAKGHDVSLECLVRKHLVRQPHDPRF